MATAAAENTPAHWLEAPAWTLMAERVNEPDPGKHWKKLPLKFATPSIQKR